MLGRKDNVRRTYRSDEHFARRDFVLGSEQEPPLGAHLVTPRLLYRHHGIYVGNGRVIHYAGLARGLGRGPVEEVSLGYFGHGREIRVRHELRLFHCCEVVERARSRLGEDRYRILTNNCEHLCAWALRGETRMGQLKRLGTSLRMLYRAICGSSPASGQYHRAMESQRPR
jgi:hypothetical protein